MLSIRILALSSLALIVFVAPSARAANQLYQGSWVAESFGNDRVAATAATGGHDGTGASEFFSVFGMPQGVLCNALAPLCPMASTPVSTPSGNFDPRGGLTPMGTDTVPFCRPITAFGTSVRPANGATAKTAMGDPIPPLYRNPFFFTAAGAPKATSCTAYTTVASGNATQPLTTNDPLRGVAMKGAPVSGSGVASATAFGTGKAFTIPPAVSGPVGAGMRRTTLGEFNNIYPYLYSYTYVTLRNDAGSFFAGGGPGDFTLAYQQGANTVAKAVVNQGPNQFGGVMRLLGKLSSKVCYFRNGGCSLGGMNWRYDAIGASAYTSGGQVIGGYIATYTAKYYNGQMTSTVLASGSRFPWTTGTALVTATGRGPHKTIERRKGYDGRDTAGGGNVQLVTPLLTRWLQPASNFETGGIGVLRFEFAPEPRSLMALAAGLSVLLVLYRARGR
jgi:hypothetical protein